MDGTLVIEDGTHSELIEFLCINGAKVEGGPLAVPTRWLGQRMRWLQQYNPLWRAEKNVAHHYDLSGALYELFEVNSQHFQCAIFFKTMHYSVIGYGIFCNTAGSFPCHCIVHGFAMTGTVTVVAN